MTPVPDRTLDGVIQDPGGFGETAHGGWANPDSPRTRSALVASATVTGPLPWGATVIDGDVAAEIARLKQEPGGDIEVYGSATLVQTRGRHPATDRDPHAGLRRGQP